MVLRFVNAASSDPIGYVSECVYCEYHFAVLKRCHKVKIVRIVQYR